MKKLLLLSLTVLLFSCGEEKKEERKGSDAVEFFKYGVYFESRGNYKGAIANYTNAIWKDPKYADAYVNRANSKFQLDDFNGALADLNKAIEIKPNNGKFYLARSIIKFQSGYEGACQDARKSQELDNFDLQEYLTKLGFEKKEAEVFVETICKYGTYENQFQDAIKQARNRE